MNKQLKTQLEEIGLYVDDNKINPTVSIVEPHYINVKLDKDDTLKTIIQKFIKQTHEAAFFKGQTNGIKLFKKSFKEMFEIK
jgi:hypothetical protein